VLLSTVAGGTALVGCSVRQVPPADAAAADPSVPASTSPAPASAPSTPPSTTVTTTAAVTTPGSSELDAVPPAPVIDGGPRGLATGAKGPAVAALEERLTALRFSPGKADAAYDSRLALAVMAFQKQQDLPRTGRADPATLAKLAVAPLGAPLVAPAEGTRVEIDLKRQIVQFWQDGRLRRVLAVSTGSGQRYCVPKDKGGGCDTAITPGGSYRADRKIQGLRVSALGSLYDPVYFFGGIAIHGSPSIPATPASHGCVRVAMWESAWVHKTVSVGDPVYVVGGKVAPVPFGETAPLEAPDEVTVPTTAVG
ncbi:MAG: L,D-transpeptidase family protein, partial [Acidimicrobiales bacterium]